MEEDIKILEELTGANIKFILAPEDRGFIAIENLIKGYRELQKERDLNEETEIALNNIIMDLEEDLHEMTISNNHKKENWVHKNCLNSYIPKSKIKEKIDELKQEKDNTYTKFLACNRNNESLSTKGKMLEGSIQVLQELMEDK